VLRAELFGHGQFWLDSTPLQLPSKQSRSLLAYLLVHPQPQSRERLAGLFWPDLEEDQARKRLSQVLWQIRRVLGEYADWIRADAQRIGWLESARLESDYATFQNLLSSKEPTDWEAGLAVYQGDLLSEIYDDWVLEERDSCREQALSVLQRLVRFYQAQGAVEQALGVARRLVELEPLDEEAQRNLLRLYLLLGRKREALEQYRRAVKALEELGEQPGPELESLRHLAEETGQRRESPLEMTGSIGLVGRSAERQILLESLQGRSGVALIEGEAGMGKSRLLQEVLQAARWQGFMVLQAKANQSTIGAAYGLLREALGGLSALHIEQLKLQLEPLWLGVLAGLIPRLHQQSIRSSLGPEEQTRRTQEGLVLGLQALCQNMPLLLLLDDLHWADEETLEVLPRLAHSMVNHPVQLMLGYRSGEARERPAVWNTVQRLGPQVMGRVELKLLSEMETAELVRRSLGLAWPVPKFEARIYRETQGNPLFVLETLRSLYEEGLLHRDAEGIWATPVDEQTADYGELPLAPTVRQVIVDRLRRLPKAARRVADALAVLQLADLEGLSEVVARPKAEVLNVAADLIRQGLFVEREGKLAFAHDKIAQTAYEEVKPDELRGLHSRAGQTLEAKGLDPAQLARHFELAQDLGKALEHYAAAAAQAQRIHAYAAAYEMLNKAVALAEQDNLSAPQRLELLLQQVEVGAVLGTHEANLQNLESMSSLCANDPRWLLKIADYKARGLHFLGRPDQGERVAREALVLAQPLGDPILLARAIEVLGHVLLLQAKNLQARPHLEQAVELYSQIGDAKLLAGARRNLGVLLRRLGEYELGRRHLQEALQVFEQLGDVGQQLSILSVLGISFYDQRDFAQAQTCYQRALQLARQIGSRSSEARVLSNLALLYGDSGYVKQGLEVGEQSLALYRSLEDSYSESLIILNQAYLLRDKLGDYDQAEQLVEAGLKLAQQNRSLDLIGIATTHKGELALLQGEYAQARGYFELALEQNKDQYAIIQTILGLGKACLETSAKEGLKHLEQAEQKAQELGIKEYQVKAMAVRARVWFEQGQLEDALDLANRAAQILRQSSMWDHTVHYARYLVLQAKGHPEALSALEQARADLLVQLQDVTPEQLRLSLQKIPEHRQIMQAWEAHNVQRTRVRLPKTEAPTGRPLREDEYIEIAWTLSTPDDNRIADKTQRRQTQLKRLIAEAQQQGAAPTLDDLVEALQASKATLKRDLAALRAEGVELRTRGSREGRGAGEPGRD
jgi:DNA-binding SARP family transcriptional activator/uncharacterized protein HemY